MFSSFPLRLDENQHRTSQMWHQTINHPLLCGVILKEINGVFLSVCAAGAAKQISHALPGSPALFRFVVHAMKKRLWRVLRGSHGGCSPYLTCPNRPPSGCHSPTATTAGARGIPASHYSHRNIPRLCEMPGKHDDREGGFLFVTMRAAKAIVR